MSGFLDYDDSGIDRLDNIEQQIAASVRSTTWAPSPSGGDDSRVLQAMINALSSAGGGELRLPAKVYSIKTGLNVPKSVSVIGQYGTDQTSRTGTWFNVTDTANAAVTLATGSRLEGISFAYPNQTWTSNAPVTYPATVALSTGAIVRHAVMRDLFFLNSYQGFDFTAQHERLHVENVHGYPISLGMEIDGGSDVDVFIDVEFNPNAWSQDSNRPSDIYTDYAKWTWNNGIGFKIRRTDWSEFFGCGAFGYKTGFDSEIGQSAITGAPSRIRWHGGFFDGCGTCLLFNSGAGFRFIGTTFTSYNWDTDDFGVGSAGTAIVARAIDGLTFIGCNFLQSQVKMITSFARELIIDGCYFTNWGSNGGSAHAFPVIELSSDTTNTRRCSNLITGNLFEWSSTTQSSTAQDGIHLLDQDGTKYTTLIQGNTFDNIGGVGVYADSGADDFSVVGNTFMRTATSTSNVGVPANTVVANNLTVA